MKRLIRETEKPSFPAQCRVLAEAAVLWALLAAGAQLLLPAEKTALPEGAALAWAALRICLVTPLAEELAFRGGALYLLQPLGGAGAVVVQAVLCGPARHLDGPGLCAGHGAHLRLGGPESEERMARQRVTYYK